MEPRQDELSSVWDNTHVVFFECDGKNVAMLSSLQLRLPHTLSSGAETGYQTFPAKIYATQTVPVKEFLYFPFLSLFLCLC